MDLAIREIVRSIEKHPRVVYVVTILNRLKDKGLHLPSVASGWTRGWLCNIAPTDIDIQYAGTIQPKIAQKHLRDLLAEFGENGEDWDVKGLWNTEQWKGLMPNDYYTYYFVTSIDSVYLSADGTLHDPTGYGLADAQKGILRMNNFMTNGYSGYTYEDYCYFCMRGCERIVRNGWNPTDESVSLIKDNAKYWEFLKQDRKNYLVENYIKAKISPSNWNKAKVIYTQYNWGFLFD